MKIESIYDKIEFKEEKPSINPIMVTDFTKEVLIAMKEGQEMKEHQTPFPIVVEMIDGEVDFIVEGKVYDIKKGDILTLSGAVPHSLLSKKESIIRLTLSKLDRYERVKKEAEK